MGGAKSQKANRTKEITENHQVIVEQGLCFFKQ